MVLVVAESEKKIFKSTKNQPLPNLIAYTKLIVAGVSSVFADEVECLNSHSGPFPWVW